MFPRTSEHVSLSKDSLKRVQSELSGVLTLAKQLGYYEGVDPLQDTRVDPRAADPSETYAYSLEEVQALLAVLPEPASTAFAVAAFMGCGSVRSRHCSGTAMVRCTFLAQSGLLAPRYRRGVVIGIASRGFQVPPVPG